MNTEPQAIEVEVVEVDGIVPAAREAASPLEDQEAPHRQPWKNWQGNIRQLDTRWWPLWVVLGILAVFLLLTFGVVIALLYLVARIIRGALRALFR